MIWSLIKVLLFVAVITLLALGAGQLMDTGGGVRIALLGVEYTLRPLQAAIALLVLIVKTYADLHWPAMLIGLGLALQAGFLAFFKKS